MGRVFHTRRGGVEAAGPAASLDGLGLDGVGLAFAVLGGIGRPSQGGWNAVRKAHHAWAWEADPSRRTVHPFG